METSPSATVATADAGRGHEPARFTGECHIITGAGSGFGRASSLRFAAEGATVVCADINESAAQETVAAIESQGGSATSFPVDVSNPGDTAALAAFALERFGRIDGLFANAGVPGAGALLGLPLEQWQRTLAVNLTGPMLCAQAVLPTMIEAGSGTVLFTASISGLRAFPNQAGYAASKGGVLALARQLALDLAPHGVRVNTISPGLIRTPVVEGIYRRREAETGIPWETALRATESKYPLGTGKYSDITAMAAFLQSHEARWITGSNHTVDGGYTA